MKLKNDKDSNKYLLHKVVEKYTQKTGKVINGNTVKEHYVEVAEVLSEISRELPRTAVTLNHQSYDDYPVSERKLEITHSQVCSAYLGNSNTLKPFFADACYIYLFGVGRKGFEQNPVDDTLVDYADDSKENELSLLKIENEKIKAENLSCQKEKQALQKKARLFLFRSISVIVFLLLLFFSIWYMNNREWQTLKKDLNILPYQPTQAEINRLEGIWLCYTGSPQARGSDSGRYHLVVANVIDVKYKNGYFTFNRYGARFDHVGYIQFESPGLVSIHSYVKNDADSIESPRHSLMSLNSVGSNINAISASWNFDGDGKNQIIGIREVYVKQGNGGTTREDYNDLQASKYKLVYWVRPNGEKISYKIEYQRLETLKDTALKKLLNEKSIVLATPQEGLILSEDRPKLAKK